MSEINQVFTLAERGATVNASAESEQLWKAQIQKARAEMAELLDVFAQVTFIAESVAHLHGREREILPTTDRARSIIASVKGE